MGCPKLDDIEAHVERLSAILQATGLRSLTVAHMEVPGCHGFLHAAGEALRRSHVRTPLRQVVISRQGRILGEQEVGP